MWDVEGASRKCRLEDHRNYVQVCLSYASLCYLRHSVVVQLRKFFALLLIAITAPSD